METYLGLLEALTLVVDCSLTSQFVDATDRAGHPVSRRARNSRSQPYPPLQQPCRRKAISGHDKFLSRFAAAGGGTHRLIGQADDEYRSWCGMDDERRVFRSNGTIADKHSMHHLARLHRTELAQGVKPVTPPRPVSRHWIIQRPAEVWRQSVSWKNIA
jgi:hypothetical protein